MTVDTVIANLTFPDGDNATFEHFQRQLDDLDPTGIDRYAPHQTVPVVVNTTESDTTLTEEQEDYLRHLVEGTDNRTIHHLTNGKLQGTFMKREENNLPETSHIEVRYEKNIRENGTHLEKIEDKTGIIYRSRIELNPSKRAFSKGLILEEISQTIGIRRDLEPPTSTAVILTKGNSSNVNREYSQYGEALEDVLYTLPAGAHLRDHQY